MNVPPLRVVKKRHAHYMRVLSVALLIATLLPFRAIAHTAADNPLITPVGGDDAGAQTLASAMVADPSILNGAHWVWTPRSGTPNGTATGNLSFFPTTGSTFGVMSNGSATLATIPFNYGYNVDGDPAPGHGSADFDTSILRLDLNAPAGTNCLGFDFAFYSNEYPQYVGQFNDSFIAELDRSTWQATPSGINAPDDFAHDATGAVVSVNNTGATGMSKLNAGGTSYGGATTLLQATTPVTSGSHSLYLSIFDEGDHAVDSAAFIDNIHFSRVSDPSVGCKPGAQPKPKAQQTPLIVIPGIGGTILRYANTGNEAWPRAQDLWDSADDSFLLDLGFQPDGVTPVNPSNPITVGEILPSTDATVAGVYTRHSDFYANLLATLQKAGYVEYPTSSTQEQTLFTFPYDFRVDDRTEGKLLLNYIDSVLKATGASQVDILAHSQGGLLTRYALSDPSSVGKVRRVLTMGTPVLGAAKALGFLGFQEPCFIDGPICPIYPPTFQKALHNLPSVYQLLPGPNYDRFVGNAVVDDFDQPLGYSEEPYDQWSADLRDTLNGSLLDLAKQFHQQSDDFKPADPSVTFYRIIGSGVPTARAVRNYYSCDVFVFNCTTRQNLVFTSGDGTVPQHSADLYNPDTHADLRGGIPNLYANGVKHTELPGNPDVDNFALSYFGLTAQEPPPSATATPVPDYTPAPPAPLTGYTPMASATSAGSATPPSGVSSPGPVPPPGGSTAVFSAVIGSLAHFAALSGQTIAGLLGTPSSHEHIGHLGRRSIGATHATLGIDGDARLARRTVPQEMGGMRPRLLASTQSQDAQPQDAPSPINIGGLSTTPSPFGGIELETTGPVSGSVADANGNIMGQIQGVGSIGTLSDMPGGVYNAVGDTQSYFLYQSGSYTSTLTVGGNGSAQLRVRSYGNSQVTGQAIFNVRAPSGAVLHFALTPGQDLSALRLQIDSKGSGVIDSTIGPDSIVSGAAVTDTVPPTTTATIRPVGDPSQQPVSMTVALAGQDNPDGSGVAATYYEIGQQSQSQRYTGPFTVPVSTTIRFLSVDNAGNTGAVQQLLVDDAPNTRDSAEPLMVGGTVRRTIAPQGDEDWFTFAADGTSTYNALLTGLPADYDLEFYDAQGNKIAASAQRGTSSEKIRVTPAAGQYYLRIVGYNGAADVAHSYHLSLFKSGQIVVLDSGTTTCHLLVNGQGGRVAAARIGVNGANAGALCVNSGGSVTAPTIVVQGGVRNQGGVISGTISMYQPPTTDPLSGTTPPGQPSASCPGPACPDGINFNAGATYRLLPGYYSQSINVNSGATVCMAPGVYYIDATWNINAKLRPYGSSGCPTLPSGTTDPGVLFYMHGGILQMNAGGDLTALSAAQSGSYAGLLYWQVGGSTIALNGAFGGGAWYAPASQLTLNSGASVKGADVIVKDLLVNSGAMLAVQ